MIRYIKTDKYIINSNKFDIPGTNISSSQIFYWLLELKPGNKVEREIGLDAELNPVCFFPNQKAPFGFFADSPATFEIRDWKENEIPKSEFESYWNKK